MRFLRYTSAWRKALLVCILFAFSGIAHAQKPGAYYLGDADSNSIIEVPDISTLATILGNPGQSDADVYTGHPQSRFRQELDGNGLIEVPDYSILLGWVTGDFSSRPGNPDQLLLDGAINLDLNMGDSVSLSAYALSPASQGSALRTGLGVIFKIDPSGTCTTAQVFGYDVAGGATVNIWRDNAAYHYTLKPGGPDNGRATVRVNTNGCTGGQLIKVEAYIPNDAEAGVVPGRFPDKLAASQLITVTVQDVIGPDTFITSFPDDPTNSIEATFEFTCSEPSCTYECKLDLESWSSCTSPKSYISSGSWTATTTTNAPSARQSQTAVWTGAEMIIWGGYDGSRLNTGGRYNPVTDSWIATSTTNAPSVRSTHTAVWTGTEMIVWGGYGSSPTYKNDGGRYNPATDSWTATTTTNAPTARYGHTAVWTGTEMIVWGGEIGSSTYTNTGGRYNPSTDSWLATTTTNAPSARYTHTAFWTGNEMIVWGGSGGGYLNTGGRYNPATDSWTATSLTNAPSERIFHSAVWTGIEMIIWGGGNPPSYLNTGGRYNPATDSWTATSISNAPGGRLYSTAVWTGTDMIVWGGYVWDPVNTGGRYNPSINSWTATSTTNAPSARYAHTAVWTGNKMIVWGGYNDSYLNTGGILLGVLTEGEHTFEVRAYDLGMNVDPTPATYSWTIDLTPPNTTINSYPPNPSNSSDASFEFSCNETNCTFECKMDSGAWGACASPKNYTGLSDASHTFQVRATDAVGHIDPTPAIYTWTIYANPPNTTIGAHPVDPTNLSDATFTFSCNQGSCVFECNLDSTGWEPCASPIVYSSLLAATHVFEVRATNIFDMTDPTPASFTWVIDQTPPETTINSYPPDPDANFYADFTFSCNESPCTFECNLDSAGWSVCASPKHYASIPNGPHTFMVRAYDLAGNVDLSPATYSWTIDAGLPDTFITSYPPDPSNLQEASFEFSCSKASCTYECKLDAGLWASCWSPKEYGGSESWVAISLTNAPSERERHTAVWTGSEMIIWGGDGPGYLNTGGRYNPATDSWTATTTTNAPTARNTHSAVWTGTVMIVWGGYGTPAYKNDGGRYNPATDSWTATTTTNAPTARRSHTAIWTVNEMVVWGGLGMSPANKNDGGRYNPANDSWTATTTTNAPTARSGHTAVWTGTEMIVWGGNDGSRCNTGGRYNPSADSWNSTSTGTNVPSIRQAHTAVWTGSEMIIWGGDGPGYLNTGGRYDPASDSWISTTLTNAPTARNTHSVVWTGAEMIVWGGYNGSYLNTGSRYDPATDSWNATLQTGALTVRRYHSAIWTGNDMIVWGGYNGTTYFRTGRVYSPGGVLSEGEHTFEVRAYDQGMNVDPTPATYTWTIDLTPPETTITLAPPDPSNSPDAEFEFSCNEADCDFECQLDASGWVSCTSPWQYTDLLDGDHTFQVRATDAAGNLESPPVEYTWTIDTTP